VTNDNRKKNIAAEVRRGTETLESAEILFQAGKLADAVSRAYYGAFHHARALLLMLGQEARTHSGVDRLLQRDLVREGLLDPEVARLLARLMTYRLEADYTAEYVFTPASAREEIEAAQRFVREARRVLASGGWIEAQTPGL
jgi:uncharacterized protein (UPF0332 family)